MQFPDEPVSSPSAIRIEDLLAADDAPAQPVVPAREGLPRSFRMRADKHYVEMLDAPPPKVETAEPTVSAPRTAEPEDADPEATAAAIQAGRDLAQSLAALRASTNLLSERTPALASTVAANLIRAESWRASCLLQVSRFLRGEIVAAPKPVRVQRIFDEIFKSIEPERRLRSLVVEERISVADSRIIADEELLICALSGLLMATAGLTEEPTFAITVTAELRGTDVICSIAQDQVRPPSNWRTDWAAAGAARVLATCNGRLAMGATSTGTEIRITIPRPS